MQKFKSSPSTVLGRFAARLMCDSAHLFTSPDWLAGHCHGQGNRILTHDVSAAKQVDHPTVFRWLVRQIGMVNECLSPSVLTCLTSQLFWTHWLSSDVAICLLTCKSFRCMHALRNFCVPQLTCSPCMLQLTCLQKCTVADLLAIFQGLAWAG